MIYRRHIRITGRVQGVGFRPAVQRLATSLGLTGLVRNDTQGVTVQVQGTPEATAEFLTRLTGNDKPPLARIESVVVETIDVVPGEDRFVIVASDAGGSPFSQVTADIAACMDCLSEMADPSDFRYRYPFINCTNCGPRYSIVRRIPYDRPNTTMSAFPMCSRCADQYRDVHDRRFHAQPVACPACGPRAWLTDGRGSTIEADTIAGIARAARLLQDGRIVAIKGIGGFHLAVDASNDQAVRCLRERKRRDHKPFAMMASSLEEVRRHALLDPVAEQVLAGPESPIVLLTKKAGSTISPSVAPGTGTFGFMLCYAPLQHMLFEQGPPVLVATSGNIADEPLICDNAKALERLGDVADAFLMHDREIHRQVDDSILHFVDNQPVLLRRARGYVPTPLLLRHPSTTDILAAGADMKNTFCLVKGNQLICSEHIGDLEDAEVFQHYVRSIDHMRGLFEVEPRIVVCDLHPGYVSTRYAKTLAIAGARLIEVQHHWAHVASVLAEQHVEGPVIGLVADGTGYGTDGAIWGCECLIASLERFERFGHMEYFLLAGGDKAAKEPIRPLMGLLMKESGSNLSGCGWLLDRIEPDRDRRQIIQQQLIKGVNVIQTSSLGRVFDAVAAMVGLGRYNHFDAQLPIALEAIAATDVEDHYPFKLKAEAGIPVRLDLHEAIGRVAGDVQRGTSPGRISAKFHNTVAQGLLAMAELARHRTGIDTVVISGGVFCNRYLANRLIVLLKQIRFHVLFNRDVPSNDGGISVGQAAIVAKDPNRIRDIS